MVKTRDKILLGVLVILFVGLSAVFISASATTSSGSTQDNPESQTIDISMDDAKVIALGAVPGTIQGIDIEKENGEFVYEFEVKNSNVVREVKINLQGKILEINNEEDEEDETEDLPITGTPLEKASQAALNHIGEGRVTDSEIGDEEGYYEIEVTLDNGDEADVHLDRNYNVLSVEYD
jgi:uncharacterized membrane protein YkoI